MSTTEILLGRRVSIIFSSPTLKKLFSGFTKINKVCLDLLYVTYFVRKNNSYTQLHI